jgi:hypothetical protein
MLDFFVLRFIANMFVNEAEIKKSKIRSILNFMFGLTNILCSCEKSCRGHKINCKSSLRKAFFMPYYSYILRSSKSGILCKGSTEVFNKRLENIIKVG